MAFNMKRPIIKGTPLHKASIAKAKSESIVSQARTKGDAGLIAAANTLGKSYKPQAIDYELDKIDIDVPEKKEKKEKQPRIKKEKQPRVKKQKKVLTAEEQAAKDAKKLARKAKRKEIGNKLVNGVKTVVGGVAMIPIAIGGGLFKLGKEIVDEFGNIVKDIEDKGAEGQKNRADKKAAAEAEKLRIQAEKEANKAAAIATKKAEIKAKQDTETNARIKEQEEYKKNPVTPIEPRGYVQPKKKEEQLKRTTQEAPDSGKNTDRFADAAEEFGYDLSTSKGWEEAEATMEYDDKSDKWINPRVTSDNPEVTIDPDLVEIQAAQAEELRKINEAKELKEQQKKEKNKGIKERNAIIDAAREYYGPDVKLTQSRFDAYNVMMRELEEPGPEIVEEDDPEVGDANYNVMEHGSIEDKRKYQEQINKEVVEETTTTPDRKPKPSDFEGSFKEKQAQYKIANEEWYQAQQAKKGKSPMEMRDNRIYRNARADGPVRRNMIKGGYTPQ